jgi:cysteine desulfurase
MNRIYLDYAATTPVDPLVLEAMQPYFSEKFANPSSLHSAGQEAKKALTEARQQVATILSCTAQEVVFLSGGTEGNNLAIFGIADKHSSGHIITSAIEHESVLEPIKELEKRGFRTTFLPVGNNGIVNPEDLQSALTDDTILVSIMSANNEIGTIQPIAEIATILRDHSAVFHVDACQSLPKTLEGIDLLTLNGGKIYGPKGVGLLYVRDGIKLQPRVFGGGHERGLRSGTENIPAIIGLAKALALPHHDNEIASLRDQLLNGITSELDQITVNGDLAARLPNNLNLTVQGVEGEILLMRLDLEGIDASAGSACTAGSADPSHVLLALGRSQQEAHQSIRFSLGRLTTSEEIKKVIEIFIKNVREIRSESGTY